VKISNLRLSHLIGQARIFLSSLVFLLLGPQAIFAFSIIQKPIIFNQARVELTREYQFYHYHIRSNSIKINPKIIVLHWTTTKTLSEAFNLFNPVQLQATRFELPGHLNVSAHFLVDRDGTIYQLMPDNWMARHVIGLNHSAIGIENVGGYHDHADLTKAQIKANAYLVSYLKKKYPSIHYLIGHSDYLKFKTTSLWLEKDPTYQTKKYDPGTYFICEVAAHNHTLKILIQMI